MMYEPDLNFSTYLISRGAYIWGIILGGKFALVIRGAYIQGGLYSGGLIFWEAYFRDFTVFFLSL